VIASVTQQRSRDQRWTFWGGQRLEIRRCVRLFFFVGFYPLSFFRKTSPRGGVLATRVTQEFCSVLVKAPSVDMSHGPTTFYFSPFGTNSRTHFPRPAAGPTKRPGTPPPVRSSGGHHPLLLGTAAQLAKPRFMEVFPAAAPLSLAARYLFSLLLRLGSSSDLEEHHLPGISERASRRSWLARPCRRPTQERFLEDSCFLV